MSAVVLEDDAVNEETAVAVIPPAETRSAALWEVGQLTEAEFNDRMEMLRLGVERVKQLQRSLLVEGTDWGKIPGVPRDMLFKSGAERLCAFYRLVPEFIATESVTYSEELGIERITYTTRCLLHHLSQDGPVVGEGVGVCSTFEKRYLYRTAAKTCPDCGKPAIRKGKAEYGGGYYCNRKDGGCGTNFKSGPKLKQIEDQPEGDSLNREPWDMANTVAKMSEKRSHTDATIRTLGVSGLFTQDEDAPSAPKGGDTDPYGSGEDWGGFAAPPEAPERAKPPTSGSRRGSASKAAERAAATEAQEAAARHDLTLEAAQAMRGVVEGEYRETFDDEPKRADGQRGADTGNVQGEIKALVREETSSGNAYWHLTLLGDDLLLYECAIPMDVAIETGVVGDSDEVTSPYADGRTAVITGKWTKRPDGMWVVIDGLVA